MTFVDTIVKPFAHKDACRQEGNEQGGQLKTDRVDTALQRKDQDKDRVKGGPDRAQGGPENLLREFQPAKGVDQEGTPVA